MGELSPSRDLIGTHKFLRVDQAFCPNSPDPFSLAEGGVWAQDYVHTVLSLRDGLRILGGAS